MNGGGCGFDFQTKKKHTSEVIVMLIDGFKMSKTSRMGSLSRRVAWQLETSRGSWVEVQSGVGVVAVVVVERVGWFVWVDVFSKFE